jgi:hypothetical protein
MIGTIDPFGSVVVASGVLSHTTSGEDEGVIDGAEDKLGDADVSGVEVGPWLGVGVGVPQAAINSVKTRTLRDARIRGTPMLRLSNQRRSPVGIGQ